MTSSSAIAFTALDLSSLPALQVVAVDFDATLAATMASVKARAAARGQDLSGLSVESDPLVAMIEELAYRKTLTDQAINDAAIRLMLPKSYGAALDHIAATYYADIGVKRLTGEEDDRFRRRITLAAEKRSPGSLGGYEYDALTAAPGLIDARALNHASGLVSPGQIQLVCLGGNDEADQVLAARAYVLDPAIKLGSDTVFVQAARRVEASASAVLEILPGPDANLVVTVAQAALAKYRADRMLIGRRVTRSGIIAALTVGAVDRVRLATPVDDIDPGPDGVVELAEATITAEVAGG